MHRSARRPSFRSPVARLATGAVVVAALSACGSSDGVATVGGATPTVQPTVIATDGARVISVKMVSKTVTPAPSTIKVDKGTEVKITVLRDTEGEVHVHGYDLKQTAKAGLPVAFDFVADQQGVFEVEAHDPDLLLFKLQVN